MTVSIPIYDDEIAEPMEDFEVNLAAGPKVIIGEVANASVEIWDDDGKHFIPITFSMGKWAERL